MGSGSGRRGGVVTQRSAKPCTPVQFRSSPPTASGIRPKLGRNACIRARLCYSRAAFLGSSVVEQPAVNRLVAGSNPARGAKSFQDLAKALRGAVFVSGCVGVRRAPGNCTRKRHTNWVGTPFPRFPAIARLRDPHDLTIGERNHQFRFEISRPDIFRSAPDAYFYEAEYFRDYSDDPIFAGDDL